MGSIRSGDTAARVISELDLFNRKARKGSIPVCSNANRVPFEERTVAGTKLNFGDLPVRVAYPRPWPGDERGRDATALGPDHS